MESVNISLAGCGFLGIYHVGVASCIKKYAPHLFMNKISGASIGALAGACLLTDVSLGVFTSEMLHIIYEIRRRPLGPFNPLVNVQTMLRNILINQMPKNAYETLSGRLFISMTRIYDGSNYIVSEFKSNEHLIEVLLASAFVPGFSGFIPPKLGEYRYIDGGFSNNLPILDENTITVSPFCGESDICPRDASVQLFHVNLCNTSVEVSKPNIYRFARILFPPGPEVLSEMCKQGFDDALKFLQRNNMISCTKCLSVQRTISLTHNIHKQKHEQNESYDPQCEECVYHIKEATSSKLPESVLQNFESSIEMANKELANWLYRHRSLKIVSIVSLPYFFTVDLILAILKKLREITPDLQDKWATIRKHLVDVLLNILHKLNKTDLFLVSKVYGPLAISTSADEKRNASPPDEITGRKEVIQLDFDSDIVINTMESDAAKNEESFVINPTEMTTVHDDAYDNLIETIDHHESLMAFYYMDDSDKMNVVEFFDVTRDAGESCDTTDAEQSGPRENHHQHNHHHHHHNHQTHHRHSQPTLTHTYMHGWKLENGDISSVIHSTEDDCEDNVSSKTDSNEQINVSSDPESEWSRKNDQTENQNTLPEPEHRFVKKSSKSVIIVT
ncbi:patatin-like phospholipase domain-containing protein 2 [Planococcus citri]|uniref:patatin-like phospholipase domain-containing protein 2 n=1 Tax=Planococcus citri TaxID=170843 RepID=UPI0031F7BE1E